MMVLEAIDLAKSYGLKRVLSHVNLGFSEGELVAVLGINGAGKSTLLGCLAGVLGWTRGEVRIHGRRLDRTNLEQRRLLALFPGEGFYFPGTDLIRNAAIHFELWRGAEAEEPADLEPWIERFGMLEGATEPMETLSRGQRYKASLIALHAADPSIWLLDEPFAAGMDARGMETFRALCRAATGRGRCVVYTTQFPELAVRFADRIVVVGDGGIAFDKPTASRDMTQLETQLAGALGIDGAES